MVTAVIALCGLQVAHALDPARDVSQYIRDAWGSEQGFPGGPVHAIAQTADGYLWLGTDKGLVRFDGVSFRLIPPTVDGQRTLRAVLGLAAGADGSLWVRLAGPGLLQYRNGEFAAAKCLCRGARGGFVAPRFRHLLHRESREA